MSLQVWMNGKLVPKEEAKVSVYDHGLLYGDGVFEGIRCYSGKVFRLNQHLQRLYESARAICLEIPIKQEELAAAVKETLRVNSLDDGYVRLVVTRGAGNLGIDPGRSSNPQVIIIADYIALYPKEFYEKGLEIVTASTIRNHPGALSSRIKSLNYLNNIMAKIEGIKAGCMEALMLNHKGEVAECTADNIFIVKNRQLRTPSLESGILDGITRRAVLELASSAGYATQEGPLTRHDIYVADECFMTGTAAEIMPVVRVDNRTIGDGRPGPVTKDLAKRYHELVRSE